MGVFWLRIPCGFTFTFVLVAMAQENATDRHCRDEKMIDEKSPYHSIDPQKGE